MADQMDIFGNLIALEDIESKMPRETIKSRFRRMNGTDCRHRCGECNHLVVRELNNRRVYKCELIGMSHSASTDIRLSDTACGRWEREK